MSSMELTSGSPLLKRRNTFERRKPVVEQSELIRAVRRGIIMTKRYLQNQKHFDEILIKETDVVGKNIFHLSVKRVELLEFLLKSFKDHPNLKQALYMEDINGHTPVHIAVLQNEKASFQVLTVHDPNLFDVKSQLDGKTLIHCAIKSENQYIVEDIVEARPNAIFDKDYNFRAPLLYAAALEDDTILEYLLCQGVDVMESDDKGYTAFHVAAENGAISNVTLLLHYDVKLINIVDKREQTALYLACKNGFGNVVSILLESGADPFRQDENSDTCLDCAIKNKHHGPIVQLLMSDCWRELIDEYKGGARTCFVSLVTHMPRSAKILLDRCFEYSDNDPSSENYSITYDFFLLEFLGTNARRSQGLSAILENNREDCLTHIVTRKFLSVKWRNKGFKLYLANLMVYLVFHVLFNTYVIMVRGAIKKESLKESENFLSTTPTSRFSDYPDPKARPHETGPIVATIIITIFTLLNTIKELFQMYITGWKYFRQISNYFEWLLYLCVILFMFPVRSHKLSYQYGAACIAVLLTWFNLIWFMRRMPALGTYILALQKVFITLVKMLSIITLFCLSFACMFYLLLAEYERYRDFPLALLSTYISMLGDYNYDDMFVSVGDFPSLYNIKLCVFVIFTLFMSIVVNNVLIGLAVGDTDSVMNRATLTNLRQQVKYIIGIETSVLSRFLCFKTPRTTYVEYPNRENTAIEKIKSFAFGEWSVVSDEEENEEQDDGKKSEENVDAIVRMRLKKYHRKMVDELKEFRKDLLDEINLNLSA